MSAEAAAPAVGRRIPLASLERFVTAAFDRCGVAGPAAADAAEALCHADAVGLDTHGAINLERLYVPRLRSGVIDAGALPEIVAQTPGSASIDGRRGLGLVVGTRALDEALTRARACGVGAVTVRNSSHLGSAGYYAARAARAGMVGIAMTNLGGQRIAPAPGGTVPLLGTNPIAAAAPAGEQPPFVLDMSTTVVSTGRVRQADRRGETIPPGWLVGADGLPVVDPAALDAGTAQLQWLGGTPATGAYKGFGLGLLVEILCGVLAGAQDAPSAPELPAGTVPDLDVGHFFLALDPAAFRSGFRAGMDRMLGAVLDTTASYPGYPESAVEHERRRYGVPVGDDLEDSLARLSAELGVHAP